MGKTDAQAIDYVVERYGNFVLLKPPVEAATWVLWAGPFAILIIGGIALAAMSRRRTAAEAVPLSEAELAEMAALPQDERS